MNWYAWTEDQMLNMSLARSISYYKAFDDEWRLSIYMLQEETPYVRSYKNEREAQEEFQKIKGDLACSVHDLAGKALC